MDEILSFLRALYNLVKEVAFFWYRRLHSWWIQPNPVDQQLQTLANARTFEQWEKTAYDLDDLLEHDIWRQNAVSKDYEYKLIGQRLQALIEADDSDDILALVKLLRSGLVRNLGNITAQRLFNRSYAGTKLLIEDYVAHAVLAVEKVTKYPASQEPNSVMTSQGKLDVLHDTRQAFGRSTLVLQGGAIFGLCHLGVVKALHLRGLLPRIIAGTATGALIAALVGVHPDDELQDFLKGDHINLKAFSKRAKTQKGKDGGDAMGWLTTLTRRVSRFIREGVFLDVGVLEELVRDNVGDLTFEEAYKKTKRILNITVSTTGSGGIPNLLNYITAPNVLIWSAALASNTSSSATLYRQVQLLCKNENGDIVPWESGQETKFRAWTQAIYIDREAPIHRIAELFNCNHFIVSQARPYLVPFLQSDLYHPHPRQSFFRTTTAPLRRLVVSEVQHRLRQMDSLYLLPASIRRFLLDERIPAASLTLVPELTLWDFFKLLENPTKESIEYWILQGERSVWPAVCALETRCAIEIELDRGYQLVRRRTITSGKSSRKGSATALDRRMRAASLDLDASSNTAAAV